MARVQAHGVDPAHRLPRVVGSRERTAGLEFEPRRGTTPATGEVHELEVKLEDGFTKIELERR